MVKYPKIKSKKFEILATFIEMKLLESFFKIQSKM